MSATAEFMEAAIELTTDKPANVIEALARVVSDMPGISKGGRASASQGGYAYRGVEQITQAVQPLLAKHGVVFVPRVISWERDEITVAEKPWTDDRMQIAYTVYGPGGLEDRIEVGPIPAVGRDNSDKGANKCMTQAFKYALLQVLCVADSQDDAEGTTHEADAGTTRRASSTGSDVATKPQLAKIKYLVDQCGGPTVWMIDNNFHPLPEGLTKRQASTLIDKLEAEPKEAKAEHRSTMRADQYAPGEEPM